jgi:nitrogen fixation/metabolism regulation signal transduction histidine kinase
VAATGRNDIFIRVFLLFGVLVLAITLFFAFMVIPMQKKAFNQIMSTQAETVSRSIVQASSDAIIARDFGFIVEHNVEVLKNNSSIYYVLVSPKLGDKISINQKSWHLLDKFPDNLDQLESQNISYKIMNAEGYKDVYHFVYPIQFSGIEWGWLHIGFSTDQYNKYINDMYYSVEYMVGISFILIIFVGYFFARWISRPVSRISQLATQVANGNLTVRSTIIRNDEIGVLSNSFNQMIDALSLSKQQMENYNQELENQVIKRTHELAELNQDLDKRIKDEVAQRQKQEALLIHQSRLAAMGEMIGAIAHQWRQPLNALGLVQQNLQFCYQMGKLDDEFMNQSMKKSERLIQKMSSTIDDFRNFFKPNKQAELFNVRFVIQSMADLLEAQLKSHNINLEIYCTDDLHIKGFQGEFSQVILNLLNNAKDILIDHQLDQPTISIKVKSNLNGGIIVIVKDNGGGISDAIVDKIYDPYFTTKEEGKGTGIGLYMSKIIIENNMSGTLHTFNDAEGANFVIELNK